MTLARNILGFNSPWRAMLLATLLCPRLATAEILDWNTVDYTAGSLSQSFDNDSNNAGNDITITISGNTSRFQTGYPDDTTYLTGGLASSEESLRLYMNLFATDSEFVTVLITFNYAAGVDHVNFSIFDIDRSNASGNHFQDQIRNIKGVGFGITNTVAITASADNTVTSNNTVNAFVTGTAINTPDSDPGGNAFFNFGNARITSVSFDYGNAPGTGIDIIQWVGLHDIRYHPVPEVNPALVAMLVCGLAFGARAWRRAKAT